MSTFGISLLLDSLCEPVDWGPHLVLMIRSTVLSILSLLSKYSELDSEENELEVRLFDKQCLLHQNRR